MYLRYSAGVKRLFKLLVLVLIVGVVSVETEQVVTAKVKVETVPLPDVVTYSLPLGPSGVIDMERSAPDFTAYRDVSERKRAFFDYLLPKIREANEAVIREREWLLALTRYLQTSGPLPASQLEELSIFEKRYAVRSPAGDPLSRIDALLARVDVVPASLILAQAAYESGWGTSRFAREGKNFFGIRCFDAGCGLTPRERPEGNTHEVAVFGSTAAGVQFYMRAINSHEAYQELRQMRAHARQQDQLLPGIQLATGLARYSQRGDDYIKEIQSMIRYNELQRFTRQGNRA